ncbi:MAG: flagellin [Desulfobacula sp.]|jgi:flagellin-like hook-associated protein FlgL|nr:flagellin [Desulfobacula sp.]
MSLAINTNIAALIAQRSVSKNSNNLSATLKKLSSGLRINSAADDASGMLIADSLRSQRLGLGQAVKNANDGISMLQIADGALEESIDIINTIKQKSIQAASDGQTTETRKAIQSDIDKLLEEFDVISKTTSFNGQKLLSGNFVNKQIQVGAYSGETVNISIGSADSNKVGHASQSTVTPENVGVISMQTTNKNNEEQITTIGIDVQYNNDPENGIGSVADEINKWTDITDIKAVAVVESTSNIKPGQTGKSFSINGISIGDIPITANDADGALVKAINQKKLSTGVEASVTHDGNLFFRSEDGRSIEVTGLIAPPVINAGELTTLGSLRMITKGFNQFEFSQVVTPDPDYVYTYTTEEDRAPNTLYTAEIPSDPNIILNVNTKHFYQFVQQDDIAWDTAATQAQGLTWEGMTGYLATITSADEDAFIYNLITENAWIGASDASTDDEWRWVTGPEGLEDGGQGRQFFEQQGNGGVAVNGEYNNWDQTAPEPNNAYAGGEHWAYVGGVFSGPATGTWWNRLIDGLNNIEGYVVEYGGMPGDPDIVIGDVPTKTVEHFQAIEHPSQTIELEETGKEQFTLGKINVLTNIDASIAMEVADASLQDLDKIRSDIGATQNQLESTISNISMTMVQIASSESGIRDIDFADEYSNYTKINILQQTASFALSQANASAQRIMELLQ